MPSRRKLAPVVGKDGISSGSSSRDELSTVELDTTFGRLLGLAEGQRVGSSQCDYCSIILITIRLDCSSILTLR